MEITKTIGGHEVRNFRKLDEPIVRYSNFVMVYAGDVFNDYTKKFQDCQWNEYGEVINRNVPKYDVDLSSIIRR